MTIDQDPKTTPRETTLTPEVHELDSGSADKKPGKKALAGITAGAVLVGGAATAVIMNFLPRNNNAPNPSETPVAAAPVTPGSEASATVTPEVSATPEIKLPFDPEVVAVLEKQSPEDFAENGEKLRLQYWLADQWNAKKTNKYAYYTSQELQHVGQDGIKYMSEYGSFGEYTLGTQAKGQDILNSYLLGMIEAGVNKDQDTRIKLVSGFVRDPNSANYQQMVEYVTTKRGVMPSVALDDPMYTAIETETVKGTNKQGEVTATVRTTGGYEFSFVFVPINELSKANLNKTDDDRVTGIWLNTGWKQGKISIDYGNR